MCEKGNVIFNAWGINTGKSWPRIVEQGIVANICFISNATRCMSLGIFRSLLNLCVYIPVHVYWWHSWLRNCATSWKDTGSIPGGSLWNFSLTLSFLLHYGFGIDSVSNRNEYQEYFLEGKGGQCIWEPHPPGILGAWPGLYKDSFTFFTCLF